MPATGGCPAFALTIPCRMFLSVSYRATTTSSDPASTTNASDLDLTSDPALPPITPNAGVLRIASPIIRQAMEFLNNMTSLKKLSDTDTEDSYTPYAYRPETYIVPVVFFIIFVVGVLGNGTLVIIFVKHRAMRNVPNTYILSLALADLLVITTCVPFTSIIYTLASWPWGVAVCKISETGKDVSVGVSVFTLTALSAERYCVIVNPLRRLQTRPFSVGTAISIWVLAILLALPDAIFATVIDVPVNNSSIKVCTPFPDTPYRDTYAKYSVAAKAIIYYILPLIIISIFYILMAKKLNASTKQMPGEIQGQSAAQAKARRNVARMVLAFVFMFFVCFFPYHLFMIWFHFNPYSHQNYNDFWHVLKIIGFCLSFLNSCVNPIALYFVSRVFRQHFNRYLFCRRPKRRPIRTTPSRNVCETSFTSTYRRPTQAISFDSPRTLYRKPATRAAQQETAMVSFDLPTYRDFSRNTTTVVLHTEQT
ncbi:PREDICTED: neuropeptide CCHamide-2 receptor-like [Nicrophorus vespilloides]|uniref:Neuropeptide CCHamide-2 receptor-like n=1 Tax=Nicrophorus vespilloides TaxID=110193 RepID=A0ABM1MYG5_NICVS|nr:PREDICTED: neuropeptide CCHamide-2 receptor-like [Nicrophorus vespilloides]